ncbi:hypothetical protein ACB092_10G031400 [Castanea dentata]
MSHNAYPLSPCALSLALCHHSPSTLSSPSLFALRSVFPTLPHSPSVSLSLSSLPHPLQSVVDASVEPSQYPPSLITDMQALIRVEPRPSDDTQLTRQADHRSTSLWRRAINKEVVRVCTLKSNLLACHN